MAPKNSHTAVLCIRHVCHQLCVHSVICKFLLFDGLLFGENAHLRRRLWVVVFFFFADDQRIIEGFLNSAGLCFFTHNLAAWQARCVLKQFDLYLHSTTAAHDRQRDLKSIHAALYV